MRRDIHREITKRQGHACPIYPKEATMQYAQSPLGIVHNQPSCQHTPLNMHFLMQTLKVIDNGIPWFIYHIQRFQHLNLKPYYSILELKIVSTLES